MKKGDLVKIRHNGFTQDGEEGEIVRLIQPYAHVKVKDGYILIRTSCIFKKKKSLGMMFDEYIKKIKEEEIDFLQKKWINDCSK